MIDSATGMRPGERYAVENQERTKNFGGFFLDGKYYLGPELMTAVGWLEGQTFIYDELDATGEPVFPDRVAGTVEDLTLVLHDGARLKLRPVPVHAPQDPPAPAPVMQKHHGRLHGKTVVITGASSGIGRAAAHAFAEQNTRLVLAARDQAALDEVVEECAVRGAEAIAVKTDVTRNDQMLALAEQAAAFGNGRIDIWINNAGVGAVGNFENTPLEAHEQVLQTDLLGYLRGAYAAWPYFKAQNSGILINTLSLGSWVAQPYAAAYSASKYGLRGLTQALRGELVGFPDIHVCDIYPAVMDTPGFRDGGNFTGHALKPPPPVYDPHRVAQAMVAVRCNRAKAPPWALPPPLLESPTWCSRPSRNCPVGLPASASIAAPAARRPSGNLFAPATGERRVEGGWRQAGHPPYWLVAAGAALLVGGFAVARNYQANHKRRP
ncbi:SDR family oxidoreductase [Pseudomonas sp. H2_H03]